MSYKIRTSIAGRRFGLGSSDQIIDQTGARLDAGRINLPSTSSGATIANNGLTDINSTATAANMLLAAPVEGCRAEITVVGGSSLVTLNCAAAGFTIGTSSTALVFTGAAANGLKNITAILRGVSSTAYRLLSVTSTAVVTLG